MIRERQREGWGIQTATAKGNLESIKVGDAKASKRAAGLVPMISDLKANGAISIHQIAAGLNEHGIKSVTFECGFWTVAQIAK
jgi:hypothetical protein